MKVIRTVSWIIFGVLIVFSFTWLVQGNDFFMHKYFAPKYEQTRREVFEQSKAYSQGMIQELQNMQFEYVKSTPEQKATLASIILHRAADFNMDQPQVPAELRHFVEQLRHERASAR